MLPCKPFSVHSINPLLSLFPLSVLDHSLAHSNSVAVSSFPLFFPLSFASICQRVCVLCLSLSLVPVVLTASLGCVCVCVCGVVFFFFFVVVVVVDIPPERCCLPLIHPTKEKTKQTKKQSQVKHTDTCECECVSVVGLSENDIVCIHKHNSRELLPTQCTND